MPAAAPTTNTFVNNVANTDSHDIKDNLTTLLECMQDAKIAMWAIEREAHSMRTKQDGLKASIKSLKQECNALNQEMQALEAKKNETVEQKPANQVALPATQDDDSESHDDDISSIPPVSNDDQDEDMTSVTSSSSDSDDDGMSSIPPASNDGDSDDRSVEASVAHATPAPVARSPTRRLTKKATPKKTVSKRKQPTSPKKWRRMIRTQRLRSILLD